MQWAQCVLGGAVFLYCLLRSEVKGKSYQIWTMWSLVWFINIPSHFSSHRSKCLWIQSFFILTNREGFFVCLCLGNLNALLLTFISRSSSDIQKYVLLWKVQIHTRFKLWLSFCNAGLVLCTCVCLKHLCISGRWEVWHCLFCPLLFIRFIHNFQINADPKPKDTWAHTKWPYSPVSIWHLLWSVCVLRNVSNFLYKHTFFVLVFFFSE